MPVPQDEIIYVGKSVRLKDRFNEYISDKKEASKVAKRVSPLRDNIRILFQEYGNQIDVYYAQLPPDRLTAFEDYFIQVLDPILNSSQKLDEDSFVNYENAITANLESGHEAFVEIEEPLDESEFKFRTKICGPEDAF